MKRTIISLFLVFFVVLTFAQNPYLKSPSSKDFPDADVIVLREKLSYILDKEGKLTYKVERVEKVFTYEGFDLIGDPLIPFNKENQEIVFKKLRTYQSEGKIVDAKQNSFNEMTPFELEKCPDYTAIRQMVATKVGLDIDSVVETEYEIKDKKQWRRFLDEAILISDLYPVLEKEIEIVLPRGLELNYLLLNSDEKIVKTEKSDEVIYSLKFKNLERLNIKECNNFEEYLTPYFIFTTAPDWGHQAILLSSLIKESLSSTSPLIKEKVLSITEKLADIKEKVRAIHEFVATKIRTAEWQLKDFDFTPRKLGRIYETSYGNKIDKSILLCGMLKEIGLKPEILFVTSKPFSDAPLPPSLSIFENVIVKVDVDGKPLFLNPAETLDKFSIRDLANSIAFFPSEGSFFLRKIGEDSKDNSLLVEIVFSLLDGSKEKGVASITLKGSYSRYEQFIKNGNESEAEQIVKAIIPSAEEIKTSFQTLSEYEISFKSDFVVDLQKGGLKKKVDAILETSIPSNSLLKENHLLDKEFREMPKLLKSKGVEHYKIVFETPKGFKQFNKVKEISFEKGSSIVQKFSEDGSKKILTIDINFPQTLLSKEEYKEIRKVCGLLLSEGYRNIYFEKEK